MKPFRQLIVLLSLSLGAVAGIAGCGERTDPLDGVVVLDRALSSDPESLDPQRARSTQAADVLRDLGEGLAGYSATGELIPAGALNWTVADDGLSYRFSLRQDNKQNSGKCGQGILAVIPASDDECQPTRRY